MKAASIVSSALTSVSALSAPSAATAASAPCVRSRCARTAPDLTSSLMAPDEVEGEPPLVSMGGGTPSPPSWICVCLRLASAARALLRTVASFPASGAATPARATAASSAASTARSSAAMSLRISSQMATLKLRSTGKARAGALNGRFSAAPAGGRPGPAGRLLTAAAAGSLSSSVSESDFAAGASSSA
eukprot:CAMPEP_0179938208 /NCGR_PEP_ID=MMETSP0983-20121128/14813_1 /TAXON_ID=483367 /ORGANISM="non described non described, Strain CCMP 2436" /LENGTH=188 /DNA_ID=CAMNT_0021844133 /DNA_START=1947 /DNA_END=2509 /DNA_ORIENTATION=-